MTAFGDFLDSTGLPQNTTVGQFAQFLDQQPQMTGAAREVALPASAVAKGALTSLGLPAFLKGLGDKYISDPLLRLFGVDPNTPTAAKAFSTNPATTQEFLDVGRNAGLVDRPDLVPQNERERLEAAAFQGIGGAIPFAPLAPGAAGIAGTLAGGAGSGVGSYEGRKAGEALGYPRAGEVLGGVLGGFGGQMLGNLGVRTANAALGNYGELGQAFKDAGVPINFTGNKRAAAYSSQSLGGAGRTQSLLGQESDAFGKSANNIASGLGTSTTLQELGDTAQSAGKQWIANFKAQSGAAHNAVSMMVGSSAPVTPAATRTVLADIKASAGGSPEAEAFLKSGLTKDIEGIIANAPNGTLPWQTVRAIRSRIGEYLENPQLIADAGTAQAKRLYGALTDDLRTTAAASSNPNALTLFDKANQYTQAGHSFIENVLSPVMSKNSPAAAQFLLNSAKSGDQLLGPLRQNLPKVADEVGAFKLRDMALSPNGAQNAAGTQVSPGSFLTDWNALSPEAKAALYADPAVRSKVNALATIAEDVKSRQALLNTSKTAHHGALTSMALAGAAGAERGYEMAGIPGAVGGAAAGMSAIPLFNYGYSLLGANRPLARALAARGAPNFVGQGAVMGGLLAGNQAQGLLAGP